MNTSGRLEEKPWIRSEIKLNIGTEYDFKKTFSALFLLYLMFRY